MSEMDWRYAAASDVVGPEFKVARFRNSYNNRWLVDKLHGVIINEDGAIWLDSRGHMWEECQVRSG